MSLTEKEIEILQAVVKVWKEQLEDKEYGKVLGGLKAHKETKYIFDHYDEIMKGLEQTKKEAKAVSYVLWSWKGNLKWKYGGSYLLAKLDLRPNKKLSYAIEYYRELIDKMDSLKK